MIGLGAWVKCDDCGTFAVSNRQDIRTFLGVARRKGWTRADPGWHWCPTCTAQRAQDGRKADAPPKDVTRSTKPARQVAGFYSESEQTA